MDKLEHFLRKNHHRVVYYFTSTSDMLVYVMVLSIFEGVVFMVDVKDGDIPFTESGSFQKRFFVSELPSQEMPVSIHDQPIDKLIRDKDLLRSSLKILQKKNMGGNLVILGPSYLVDVSGDGSFNLSGLADFPDTLDQHGIFQKYDLEYFYNYKNTISQNVKVIYGHLHQNFLENLEQIKSEWDHFSKDPSRHFSGLETLLSHYGERAKQCDELKKLIMTMYQIWKQLSSEYELIEARSEPVSFDQNLQLNQKKQQLYRKLDRIKLIEKHATDLLVKIHVACTCLMFYIHMLTCEMGTIHFRIDQTIDLQDKLQKFITQVPSSIATMINDHS